MLIQGHCVKMQWPLYVISKILFFLYGEMNSCYHIETGKMKLQL